MSSMAAGDMDNNSPLKKSSYGDSKVVKHGSRAGVRLTALAMGLIAVGATVGALSFSDLEVSAQPPFFHRDSSPGVGDDESIVAEPTSPSDNDSYDDPSMTPSSEPSSPETSPEDTDIDSELSPSTSPSPDPSERDSAHDTEPGGYNPDVVTSQYHIVWGDTLSEIAYGHDTGVNDLANSNDIYNPNLIYAGDTLVITPPNLNKAGQDVRQPDAHYDNIRQFYVEAGDTWDTVANKTGLDANKLKEANAAYGGFELHEGMTIVVRQ